MSDTQEPKDGLVALGNGQIASRSGAFVRRGLDLLSTPILLWSVMEALALAIDAKVGASSPSHIRRIVMYATGLAKALGLSDAEVKAVNAAALLHDIGKLAVPEYVLGKPGPLTQIEFQKLRVHPQVGAGIIAGVPFPYEVAPLILSHHERWDGRGYPAGLKGEEIPLGARIVSVVDYFDALTSERPYHKAMTLDAALGYLKQESGKALDPRIVQSFVDVYPTLSATFESDHKLADEASRAQSSIFYEIASTNRETYAQYDIAQTLSSSLGVSDTMALVAPKLNNIVPFSCCALFLFSEASESLRCRFATGVEAEIVNEFVIRIGHGLAGWVTRNRRSLINGRPSADFEAAGVSNQTVLQSALVCPLVFNERSIGALAVYHSDPSIYVESHLLFMERLSEQFAVTVYNSIVFEQTQEDSLTDALTALPNPRFMFMHLTRELARANRLKSELAILVGDLDDFKKINDTYGFRVGDHALREVSVALRACIRPYDIVVRWMSDKFIVILSGCEPEEAEWKRLELQRAVDGLQFEARPGHRVSLAISLGAAVFPHDGDDFGPLVDRATERMRKDKRSRS